MAFCGLAAALRPWNRTGAKFIVTVCLPGDFSLAAYVRAARIFLDLVADKHGARLVVNVWGRTQAYRDQQEALDSDRALFIKEPNKALDDEARLFADAVVDVPSRCRRHVEAALRRSGVPIVEEHVELLLSEPWSLLDKVFQDRRSPMLSLQRLKRLPRDEATISDTEIRDTGPRLADLNGYGAAADWGHELAIDIADYKAGKISWEDVDPGVLLSGPPGTGKTMFATALANTCKVPIINGSPSAWQEAGSLDDHLKAMRKSFDDAKEVRPSILFIDEIDAIGDRDTKDRNQIYARRVITGLLELLDGFDRREGVVVVAACNRPSDLDPAIKRAGRLDRQFEIAPPDNQARLSILKHHSDINLDAADAEVFGLASSGLSGADIKRITRDAKRSARRRQESLTPVHLLEHLPPVIALPDDYIRAIAVHEAGHAVIAVEMGFPVSHVRIASHKIEGGYGALGGVAYSHSDLARKTRAHFLSHIAISLGGVVAEMEVFGSFSDFSSGSDAADLNVVTNLATLLEAGTGMGKTLIVEDQSPSRLERLRDFNPELRRNVEDVIATSFDRARMIIQENRAALDDIVGKLVETRSMSGDEVYEIVQLHKRPKVSLAKSPRPMGP
ncbi:AAA family ATPase [Sinorhizobium medicae]|nr:AAA family ATPase [Sinorhizobium medicae]MDX1006613.1 AAA family ATPase [Sinorhizobium medicae]